MSDQKKPESSVVQPFVDQQAGKTYYVVFAVQPMKAGAVLEMVRAQLGIEGEEYAGLDELVDAVNASAAADEEEG